MTISISTTSITEFDLEAALPAVLANAMPWLNTTLVEHQVTFTFTFGHAQVTVDGRETYRAGARADTLVKLKNGRNIAVLEFKRPGLTLTSDDDAQGLSYARVLNPMPPLVVVTNGQDVRILETHSGLPWTPATPSMEAFNELIGKAARIASADAKDAIAVLMGTSPAIWRQAVRQASATALKDATGSWNDPLAPFVEGVIFPRDATQRVLRALADGDRMITLEGAPLSGKSNGLRELVTLSEGVDAHGVLYIDGSRDADLFEVVADLLTRTLDWPVGPTEARHWLMSLAKAGGPPLVLAIDGLPIEGDRLRRDIEWATSNQTGPALRVVLALDDGTAHRLCRTDRGRTGTPLMRRATRIDLGPLGNDEFWQAAEVLWDNRLSIARGAQFSEALRSPWVLRSLGGKLTADPTYQNPGLAATLPTAPAVELIQFAREQFNIADHPFSAYRALSGAVLADARDEMRPSDLVLEALETFIVRRTVAAEHLSSAEVDRLVETELLRPIESVSGELTYSVRLPALMASELSLKLAAEVLALARNDAAAAADVLVAVASSLPMGEVIAAQAILDAAEGGRPLPVAVILALLADEPTVTEIAPGVKARARMPGGRHATLHYLADGALDITVGGRTARIPGSPGEVHTSVSNQVPWLILSHLALHPFLIEEGDGQAVRGEGWLITELCKACVVLKAPGGDIEINSVPVHHLPNLTQIVCHNAGLVEPVTVALFRFLSRAPRDVADEWIDMVVEDENAPSLGRLLTALAAFDGDADKDRAQWALDALERVRPALGRGATAILDHA